ncbi:uncharacterized protein LOC105643397 isoform X2 [Jatropha curcas]|uniref:uncharacterized protein LOC105643397 isoform X2 n=1 Tax=Jatropha curcas TaxID=180498 RepID=UPI0009D716CC|nr:uncharacterized protein LOC105643397 isoform X2 [Jatropha curcas]
MLTRSATSHLLAPTLMPPPLRLAKSESCRIFSIKGRKWAQQTKISSSSSENQTVTVVSSPKSKDEDDYSASEVVKSFYQGINDHDLSFVEKLIAENCVYEDLIYPRPFVGRKAILEFFKKFNDSISKDLQFVIDDISAEDSLAVGVTWHLVMGVTVLSLQSSLEMQLWLSYKV